MRLLFKRLFLVLTLIASLMIATSCEFHVHNYVEEYVAPTCGVKGYTEHTCIDCGFVYKDQYINANNNHTYENGICTGCGMDIEDDIAGSLRIVSQYSEGTSIYNGHAYLVYTNTTKRTITINFADLFGIYKMSAEFKKDVNNDVKVLSWRYDGSATDAEHLAIAEECFTYCDKTNDSDYKLITVEPNEFITIGAYNMSDSTPYAVLAGLAPTVEEYFGKNTMPSALVNIAKDLFYPGTVSVDSITEVTTMLSDYLLQDDNFIIAVDNINLVTTLLDKYLRKGSVTDDELMEVLIPLLEDTGVDPLDVAFVLGELDKLYKAVENGNVTGDLFKEILLELLDYFAPEKAKEVYNAAKEAIEILDKASKEGKLTKELIDEVLEPVLELVLEERCLDLVKAIEKLLFDIYQMGSKKIPFDAMLLLDDTNAILEIVLQENEYQMVIDVENCVLDFIEAVENGEITVSKVARILLNYLVKYVSVEIYEEIMEYVDAIVPFVEKLIDGTVQPHDLLVLFRDLTRAYHGDVFADKAEAVEDIIFEVIDLELKDELTFEIFKTKLEEIIIVLYGDLANAAKFVYKTYLVCLDLYPIVKEKPVDYDAAFEVCMKHYSDLLGTLGTEIARDTYHVTKSIIEYSINKELTVDKVAYLLLPLVGKYATEKTEIHTEATYVFLKGCVHLIQTGTVTTENVTELVDTLVETILGKEDLEKYLVIRETALKQIKLIEEGSDPVESLLPIIEEILKAIDTDEITVDGLNYLQLVKIFYPVLTNEEATFSDWTEAIQKALPYILTEDEIKELEFIESELALLYQNYLEEGFIDYIVLANVTIELINHFVKDPTLENKYVTVVTSLVEVMDYLVVGNYEQALARLSQLVNYLYGETEQAKFDVTVRALRFIIEYFAKDDASYEELKSIILEYARIYGDETVVEKMLTIFEEIDKEVVEGLLDGSNEAELILYTCQKIAKYFDTTLVDVFKGNAYGGVVVNRELFNQKYKYDQFPNRVYEVEITGRQLHSMIDYLSTANYFNLLSNNSATVCVNAWNACVGFDNEGSETCFYLNPTGTAVYEGMSTPKVVKEQIATLKNNECAKENGGYFVGENVLIPEVSGVRTLPSATILPANKQPLYIQPLATTEPKSALNKEDREIYGTVQIVVRNINTTTYSGHAYIVYKNTTTHTVTLTLPDNLCDAYMMSADLKEEAKNDMNVLSWRSRADLTESERLELAKAKFEELKPTKDGYVIALEPGEFITLGSYAESSSISEILADTLKTQEVSEGLTSLSTNYKNIKSALDSELITKEEATTKLGTALVKSLLSIFGDGSAPLFGRTAGGISLNAELFNQYYKIDQTPVDILQISVEKWQLERMINAINDINYYSLLSFNCSQAAVTLWNACVGYDEFGNETLFNLSANLPVVLKVNMAILGHNDSALAKGLVYKTHITKILNGELI